MKLHYNSISPCCRTVHMVIKLLNFDIEMIPVDIFSKAELDKLEKMNPVKTVPILQDKDLIISNSHAIISYLVSKDNKDDKLYPRNLKMRALVDQHLHFDSGVLYPITHSVVIPILFENRFGILRNDAKQITNCYRMMNRFLEGGEWLCGNHMTIADISCMSTISTLDLLYPVSRKDFPKLSKFLIRAEELPMYKECNAVGLKSLVKMIENRYFLYRKNEKKA